MGDNKTDKRINWMIFGLLPCVYTLLGHISFILSPIPGHVSIIFLPAGLGIAAVYFFGWKALPGIFIGSFLMNLWEGSVFPGHSDLILKVSAIVALAVCAQAYIGGKGINRFINLPLQKEIFYILLSIPLICLISSTLSIFAVYEFTGSLALTKYWLTWWIGDMIGLIIFLPIIYLYRTKSFVVVEELDGAIDDIRNTVLHIKKAHEVSHAVHEVKRAVEEVKKVVDKTEKSHEKIDRSLKELQKIEEEKTPITDKVAEKIDEVHQLVEQHTEEIKKTVETARPEIKKELVDKIDKVQSIIESKLDEVKNITKKTNNP